VLQEVELEESEPGVRFSLEAVLKRYKFGNKVVRRIHISERFNEMADLEKFDAATAKGSSYCVVTIKFLPKSSLEPQKQV
jgi:hypothetical protein